MSVPSLDQFLGKIYNRGVEKERRGGLNFGPGLLVTQSALGYDIDFDPALFESVIVRDPARTHLGDPGSLTIGDDVIQLVGVDVAPFELLFSEIRIAARSRTTGAMMLLCWRFVYRRVEEASLAPWGSTVVLADQRDDSVAWVTPSLLLYSDHRVYLQVTGTSGHTIEWHVDWIHRKY